MLYCENCKCLCGEEACPICGSRLLRAPESRDYCFLCEEEEGFAKMLEGSFHEEEIPCVLIPWGNGSRSAFGLSLGRFRVYVPFAHLEQAKLIWESFETEATMDWKQEVLQNRQLWHYDPKMEKKLCKKLKVSDSRTILDRVQDVVLDSEELHLGGRIYTCTQGGCHLLVKADGVKFWFNSATYEIFL